VYGVGGYGACTVRHLVVTCAGSLGPGGESDNIKSEQVRASQAPYGIRPLPALAALGAHSPTVQHWLHLEPTHLLYSTGLTWSLTWQPLQECTLPAAKGVALDGVAPALLPGLDLAAANEPLGVVHLRGKGL
jgi:hypothetical protein